MMDRAALYARVSTGDQTAENQVPRLVEWAERQGYEYETFKETASGGSWDRPILQDVLSRARRGEFKAVAVLRIDRLARSVIHLEEIAQDLHGHGIRLVILDNNLDLGDAMGWLVLRVLGAVAEFERDLIRRRTREGLDRAALHGNYPGRPREGGDPIACYQLSEDGMSYPEIAENMGISRATVGRRIKEGREIVSKRYVSKGPGSGEESSSSSGSGGSIINERLRDDSDEEVRA